MMFNMSVTNIEDKLFRRLSTKLTYFPFKFLISKIAVNLKIPIYLLIIIFIVFIDFVYNIIVNI